MSRRFWNFYLIVMSLVALLLGAQLGHAQQTARTVHYHANNIVPIRARMRYTTLIELPPTEKILEVATGDKDFWIVDAVGNDCFLHPAKADIHSNLNLITDKGNVYSFTLDDDETQLQRRPSFARAARSSTVASDSGLWSEPRCDAGSPPARQWWIPATVVLLWAWRGSSRTSRPAGSVRRVLR